MKRIVSLFIFTIIFGFFYTEVYASHLLGANVTYECLGPGQYRVTLQLYRDCNGVTPSSSQTLTYSSASCNGISGSISLSTVGSPTDITPNCPSVPSACGGSGNYGIQEWVYQGILNLPPGCGNDWILGWSQCCRNGAINTLSGPSSQDMFVGAVLDNTATPVCNSSLFFNNAPGSIVCVNQPVVYNHGVSDADGDSLYFSLGTCLQGPSQNVAYSGGFNGTSPLTTASGVSINPNTGAISFTPTTQQVGVLCVNVKEYRNGVLIGQVNRDMQFTVIACSNVPPQASGVNGAPNTTPQNFTTSICANGNLCFTINGTDPNSNNITMSWNNEIPGGVFTVTNNGTTAPVAQFCWNPGPSDIGQNVFTVNVEDDACPIIGQGTYTYIIDVLPSPNILDAGPTDTICFGESTVLTATSIPAALSYTWSPASSLSSSTGASVTASPLNSTNYVVSATFPDGCDLTDVVNVLVAQNPSLSVSPSNSFNCSGQANNLVATGFSNTGGSLTYNWTPGNFSGPNLTVSPTVTSTYTVTATDGIGCQTSATATVTIAAPTGNVCNVLYVTPTGSPNGTGSRTSPMDLITALEVGACNGTTVKMAVGDYITDTVINRVTSYITLEGGFDPTLNWDKISTAGATRILRTATQSYSLVSNSIVLGSGIINESGPNPEVVAMRVSNQTGFRFQDLTIETELNSPGTTMAGYQGPDIIGVRLNSCDNYNIVRTRIIADNGGAGANQIWSILATSGGDSRALEINTNGAGGNIINSSILAGTAGAGGTGTPNGANGVANNITLTGTALSTNNNNFNLTAQPVIRMNDIACTETLIDFSQTSSGAWTFGTGSAPASANGALVTTQYSSLGRKNINYGANVYTGFANILLDAQVLPAFTLSAPFIQGQYRVCAGSNVDFSATNGGVGYTYHWDMDGGASPNNYDGTGPNFQNINGVTFPTAGIYSIMLQFETNCCGLSIPTFIDLYVEEAPDVVATPSDAVLCYGSSVPININVEDNIGFGQASWSPAAGLDDINGFNVNALPGDTTLYVVTVTDSTGLCSDINEVLISVVNLELSTSVTNTTCGPDGTATVVVSGGSGNYAYQWDDPSAQTTATASNLAVGVYNVYVTDIDLGCIDSASAVINPGPGSLVGFVNNTNPVSCIGAGDGEVTVTLTGGASPYDFEWSPVGGSVFNTTSTSNTVSNLDGGNYTILLTDANGCTYTVNAFVPEPDSLIIELDSLVNPTCIGATDGYISVLVDGGNGPYTIVWDNPGNTLGQVISGIGVGTYCVGVLDDSGCYDSACFVLSAPLLTDTVYDTICQFSAYTLPSGLVVYPSADTTSIDSLVNAIGCDSVITTYLTINALPNVLANASPNDTLCEGSTLTLSGSGANTYTWNNGVTDGLGFVPNVGTTTYVVTGTDLNLCVNTDSIDITVNALPIIVANASPNDTLCLGDALTLSGSGGQSYVWDNGVLDGVAFTPTLGTSTYIVTGTDSNSCVNNDTIDILVNPLPSVLATVSPNDTVCAGTAINLSGSGASTYVWDNAVVDGVSFVPAVGTTTYIVTGTDVNGCSSNDTITIVVNPLPNVLANASPNDTLCEGSTLTLSGSGANTYTWNNGVTDGLGFVPNVGTTTYVVTGTDLNLCVNTDSIDITVNALPIIVANASPNDTLCLGDALTLSGSGGQSYVWDNGVLDGVAFTPTLGTSTYIVTGTDSNTCVNNDTIDILVNPLPSVLATVSPNDTVCAGTAITLSGSGASTYVWDNAVVDGVSFVPAVGTTSYIVTGTDANGCSSNDTITIVVNPLPNVLANASPNDTLCEGSTLTLTGSGANTYTWNNGITDGLGFVPNVGTTTYVVTGTDLNSCVNTDSIDIIVNALPIIVANASPNDTLCLGDALTLSGSGGQSYVWDNGVLDGVAFSPALGSSTYIVTGTDLNTCASNDTITIFVNSLPIVGASALPNDTICSGDLLSLSGNGASTYTWDNGISNGVAFNAASGLNTYTVTGTDLNSCVNTASIDIFGLPSYSSTVNASICEDEFFTLPDGNLVNQNGSYSVTLQSVDGCDSTIITDLVVNQIGSFIALEDLVVCDGFSAELNISTQNMVSFEWFVDNGSGPQSLIGNTDYIGANSSSLSFNLDPSLHLNSYSVQMLDECGRPSSSTMTLEVYEPHPVANPHPDTTFCNHEIAVITVDYNGFNYEWNNGEFGTSILPDYSGDYIVNFVENGTNCLLSDTINIEIEDCIGNCVVLAPTGFSPNGSGTNDIFRVITTCDEGFSYFQFNVYNRWGELVFTTDDWRKGWDGNYKGRTAEIGTYTYFVEYTKNLTTTKEMLKGNVTIIR